MAGVRRSVDRHQRLAGHGAIRSNRDGLTQGLRRGLCSVAGLQVGLMAQLAMAAVGLGAAVSRSLLAFAVIKWIGAVGLALFRRGAPPRPSRRPHRRHDWDMHPNNAPGVPMRFPVWFENFQIKYINPVAVPLARFTPGITVIRHRGRKSGRLLETAVSAYRKGHTVAIMLGHGKTNWVKNVLAAGCADIRLGRRDVHLVNPRIVPAGTDDPSLPLIVRIAARRGFGVFVADIAD